MTPLYFDDFSVGQVFRSGTHQITVDEIKRFAREFDPQPFHLDEEAARASLFAHLVASGWHTAALTMKLLVDNGLPIAGEIIGAGMDEMRWPNGVRPGDILHVVSEVLELRRSSSRLDRGWLKVRSTTFNQDGEPVQVMVSNLTVLRRPGS